MKVSGAKKICLSHSKTMAINMELILRLVRFFHFILEVFSEAEVRRLEFFHPNLGRNIFMTLALSTRTCVMLEQVRAVKSKKKL